MALISESNLTTLTTYLGSAHESLYGGLGTDIDDRDESRNYMNRAKVFVRGGSDTDGVDISVSSSCLVSGNSPADATVSIPDGSRYYINGTLYTASGETTYTFTLVPGSASETIGTGEAYKATIYVDDERNLGVVKTPAFIYYSYTNMANFQYPSAPDNTVELANILITYDMSESPIIESDDITDTRFKTGFLGLEDDDQMAMFTSLNQDEDTLIATTLDFSNYFTRSVNTIRTHVSNFSGGRTFQDYYQYRDFEFTESFRRLYYDVRSTELSQRMAFINYSGAGSTTTVAQLGERYLSEAAQFEIYVPRYDVDGTTAYVIPEFHETTIEVFLVKDISTTLTNSIEAYDSGSIDFGDTSSFSSSGYILMDNEIAQYTSKPDSTSLHISNRGVGSPYGVATHRGGITVYEVEKKSVSITSESQVDAYNDAVSIGTSSDTYIQCAGFDTITGGNSGLAYGVRNIVS
jgi:hypothetical protein